MKKKSKTLISGNPGSTFKPLLLNGNQIDIVNEWRYLGTTIVPGKSLSFSAKSKLRAFYSSANSLLSAKLKPDNTVLMHLLFLFVSLRLLTHPKLSNSVIQKCILVMWL